MGNRLSTIQAGEIIEDGKLILKSNNIEEDYSKLWIRLINRKTAEFHELASLKDSELYRERVALSGSQGLMVQILSSTIFPGLAFSYSSSTKILTADLNHQGIWSQVPPGFNSNFLGASIILTANSGPSSSIAIYSGIISEIIDTSHCKIYSVQSIPSFISAVINGFIIKTSYTTSDYNIYSLPVYNDIDHITSLECNIGLCDYVPENLFLGINDITLANEYKKQILWTRQGELVRIKKGAGVSSEGTIYINYLRKPYKITSFTDYLDIPDSNVQMLLEDCLLVIFQMLTKPIPELLLPAQKREEERKRYIEELNAVKGSKDSL
jgi:hypothetical protein